MKTLSFIGLFGTLACTGYVESPDVAPVMASAGGLGSASRAGAPGQSGASGTPPDASLGGASGAASTAPGGGKRPDVGGDPGVEPPPIGGGASSLPYTAPAPVAPELRARTWRLSHAQYQKSVAAFLGVQLDVSDLEREIDNGVYPNMSSSGIVGATLARQYHLHAEKAVAALTSAQLAALIPGGAIAASAKTAFLTQAVAKAFRRPATADELSAYGGVFDLATGTDTALPFRSVIQALLSAPSFLYRTEIGSDAAASPFTLTNHEIASLLSYSLLDEPPSAALLAAADAQPLSEPGPLAQQIDALLSTPAASAQLQKFMTEWLKLHEFDQVDKDAVVFPEFESIRVAMVDETRGFLARYGGPAGTVSGLLTTPLPTPADPLARFYASEKSAAGRAFTRTGALALGTVMSARSKPNVTSPTLRGLFIRERFLCQAIHLPPIQPPDIAETQTRVMPTTTRELYELHASDPSCAGCHEIIDPAGFNFEDMDAAGRFRPIENGVAVDTSGQLRGTDVDGPMANHTDLANALARSQWVRECTAAQAFRFYFGQVESDRGLPPVQAARLALGDGDFRSMARAMMSSTSTVRRTRN